MFNISFNLEVVLFVLLRLISPLPLRCCVTFRATLEWEDNVGDGVVNLLVFNIVTFLDGGVDDTVVVPWKDLGSIPIDRRSFFLLVLTAKGEVIIAMDGWRD